MAKSKAKMMPQNLEAEQAVLASVLLDTEAAFSILSSLESEDFYSNSHQVIFDAMISLNRENKPVDFITLVDKLEATNKLSEIGGIDYVTFLTNFIPSSANYHHHVDIVRNRSRLRQLISAGQKIIEKAYEEESSNETLAFAEKQIFDISEKEDNSSLQHIEKGIKQVMEKFELLARDKTALRGIPTGFKQFDAITNGLQNSDLILLAARPGFGKTSLAMNLVNNAAINHGKSCAIFSYEMPIIQLVQRQICSVACVSMADALKGTLKEEDWGKIWVANKKLNESKIYIDDSSLNTPRDILSKCRRLKRERGLDLVMIDYLQIMPSGIKTENRVKEIGEITRNLKIAAKELNVPIILLSQLSRGVETRTDHRPILADLRESGSIEQDADIVLFIYKPDMYNDVTNEDGEGVCEIEIAKHRNGSLGKVKVRWVGEWVTFLDMDSDKFKQRKIAKSQSQESLDDVPPPCHNDYNEQEFDNVQYTDDDAPSEETEIPNKEQLDEIFNKLSDNMTL